MLSASKKNSWSGTTFIKVDTTHRMASLGLLYIIILTDICKVTQFFEIYNSYISGKRES